MLRLLAPKTKALNDLTVDATTGEFSLLACTLPSLHMLPRRRPLVMQLQLPSLLHSLVFH